MSSTLASPIPSAWPAAYALNEKVGQELGKLEEMKGSVRERVQISASGHTDADQLGTDFFRFRWRSDPILSAPNETESATGLKSLSGQLTKVIKNIWQLK